MAGEMNNTYITNTPKLTTDFGDNLIYPFGPPIFQSELDPKFIKDLIDEGNKLTIKEDDWRANLAGQMKFGGSYSYKEEFKLKAEKYLLNYVTRFFDKIVDNFGEKQINRLLAVQGDKRTHGTLRLDTFWINYQHKYDYNPPHTHTGVLSFVIHCKVPKTIFENQAISNTKDAGKVIFMHGSDSHALDNSNYPIKPYEGLFLLFPANLTHHVPPFWVDEERISVSGNFVVV